jgi:hypothetical protein
MKQDEGMEAGRWNVESNKIEYQRGGVLRNGRGELCLAAGEVGEVLQRTGVS